MTEQERVKGLVASESMMPGVGLVSLVAMAGLVIGAGMYLFNLAYQMGRDSREHGAFGSGAGDAWTVAAHPGNQTAILPAHLWVRVENPNGAGRVNVRHGVRKLGETCGIDDGVELERIADAGGGRLLVRFLGSEHAGYGATCPAGTLFYMTEADFGSATAKHNEKLRAEAAESAPVVDLLKQ